MEGSEFPVTKISASPFLRPIDLQTLRAQRHHRCLKFVLLNAAWGALLLQGRQSPEVLQGRYFYLFLPPKKSTTKGANAFHTLFSRPINKEPGARS